MLCLLCGQLICMCCFRLTVEEYAAVMPGESNSPNVEIGPRRGFGGIASSLFGSAIDLASNLFGGGSKPTSAPTPPPFVAPPPYGGPIWPPNAPPNYYPGHWTYPGLGHQPYPRQPLPPSYPPTAPPGQPYDYDYDYVRPSGPEYRPAAPIYDTGPTWPTRPPTAPPTAPPNTRPTWHTNPTVPPRTWAPRPGIIGRFYICTNCVFICLSACFYSLVRGCDNHVRHLNMTTDLGITKSWRTKNQHNICYYMLSCFLSYAFLRN